MSAIMAPLPAVKFRPARIAHANLFVEDFERSRRFYRDVCGLAEILFEPRGAAFLGNGASHHEIALISTQGRNVKPGLNHIAFQMATEAELVEALERGLALGLEVDHLTDHGVAHSVYIHTPDGVNVELYADIVENWRDMFSQPGDASRSIGWEPRSTPPFGKSSYKPDYPRLRVDGAILHPVAMSHAGLMADDLDRTVAFFTDVIGLEVTRRPEPGRVQLALTSDLPARARQDVALMQRQDGERPLHHLAFELEAGTLIDAAAGQLRNAGVEIEQRMGNGMFIRDPEGHRLEFFVPA